MPGGFLNFQGLFNTGAGDFSKGGGLYFYEDL